MSMHRLERRRALFGRLAAHPLSGRLLVFGSCARAGGDPVDIDIFVEADPIVDGTALASLLALARAREFYGSFDPFVAIGRRLLVRSDDASCWVRARNAGALTVAGRAGVPLVEALALEVGRSTMPPAAARVIEVADESAPVCPSP